MIERMIAQWKETIAWLDTIIETRDLTPEQAEDVRRQYETAHAMLDVLEKAQADDEARKRKK